ncbi:GlsB/YeaQ/YmgE family stress response membrane protein [Egicoccus sp. AB-alg2]|uniref:GlsB/YeaQ/YmgE family stress response membrane protein n=1 Tax=Egicoccus sp. AB-alg2 TaxID=3242693 RepID=UPI00359DA1A2
MGIIAFIILGIVAGYLGRLIMPGRQKMGFVATAALGMVGSVVGGVLGSLISGEGLALGTAGLLGSIIGVLIVLFVAERVGRGDSTDRGTRRA